MMCICVSKANISYNIQKDMEYIMRKSIDMIGQVFSRLTVISKSDKTDKTRSTYWKCKCECGNSTEVSRQSLVKGYTKSCGCLQTEARIKHDMSRSSEYKVWYGIKRRCLDENYNHYKWYGAKGITISDEWANSFEQFLEDMGYRPDNNYDIDRIDNTKGYSKDNCRWATKKTNAQNKSNSKRWVIDGITYNSQNEASEKLGISPSQINRMCKGYTRSNGKNYPPKDGCYCYEYYGGKE